MVNGAFPQSNETKCSFVLQPEEVRQRSFYCSLLRHQYLTEAWQVAIALNILQSGLLHLDRELIYVQKYNTSQCCMPSYFEPLMSKPGFRHLHIFASLET